MYLIFIIINKRKKENITKFGWVNSVFSASSVTYNNRGPCCAINLTVQLPADCMGAMSMQNLFMLHGMELITFHSNSYYLK